MDSDDRKSLRNVSLLLIGGGALLTLLTWGAPILSFGLGPAFMGLIFLLTSFLAIRSRRRIPTWRVLACNLITLALLVPFLFFDYRLPSKAKMFVLVPCAILQALLIFWPRPAEPIVDHKDGWNRLIPN
jgi:hypothetical protein